MSPIRLSLAASALAFGGTLFAQTATGPDTAAAPQPTVSGAPAAPTDARCGPRERGGPGARMQGQHRQGKRGGFMRGIDADGDGKVTREELLAAQKRQVAMFEQADTNKDGELSRNEIQAARENLQMRQCEPRRDRGPRAPLAPAAGAQR